MRLRAASLLAVASLIFNHSEAFKLEEDQIGLVQQDATSHDYWIPAKKGKSNIVFILSDDQDVLMDSVSYMPRLKEHIIDKGTHFANHFTTTALCCPARVSLWTGKQPHNTNVTDVSPPYGKAPYPRGPCIATDLTQVDIPNLYPKD
jgi:hypothetical protein